MKKKLKSKKIVSQKKKIAPKKKTRLLAKKTKAAPKKRSKTKKQEVVPKQMTIGHNPLIDYLEFTTKELARQEAPAGEIASKNIDSVEPLVTELVAEAEKSEKISKQRITLHISSGLIERFKNTVYWQPGLTLASFAEHALDEALSKVEQERGAPFPQRSNPLKSGRPIK